MYKCLTVQKGVGVKKTLKVQSCLDFRVYLTWFPQIYVYIVQS